MSQQYAPPGHGMVSEYQAAGVPFVSSSASMVDTAPQKFTFPYVARHVTIFNSGSTPVRVGFTENGVNANPTESNYFLVLAMSNTPRLELKCDEVFVRKDAGTDPNIVSIVAGLTTIPRKNFFTMSGSNGVVGVG
jgi:hypothetical protein